MSPGDQRGADRADLTRRRFLIGGATLAAGGVAAGIAVQRSGEPRLPLVALGRRPAGLPARQHAWEDTLAVDEDGNRVAPRHDRLLMFDVRGTATERHARILEAALRTLERRFDWGPSGLLFTAGWGHRYFAALGREAPVPRARPLSQFELPTIDDYDLCLHLACDDQARLAAIEAALLHGERLPGADGPLHLSPALAWRETRTGFSGAGLPATHQHTGGIPAGDPVSSDAGYHEAVRRYGVVGHAQTSARARRHGRPIILRRDFNTTDHGQAGLHFVALQRTIEDFVRVRDAMNASGAAQPRDHRHRQQRDQRVPLRAAARQLRDSDAAQSVVPAAGCVIDAVRVRTRRRPARVAPAASRAPAAAGGARPGEWPAPGRW